MWKYYCYHATFCQNKTMKTIIFSIDIHSIHCPFDRFLSMTVPMMGDKEASVHCFARSCSPNNVSTFCFVWLYIRLHYKMNWDHLMSTCLIISQRVSLRNWKLYETNVIAASRFYSAQSPFVDRTIFMSVMWLLPLNHISFITTAWRGTRTNKPTTVKVAN